MLLKEKIAVVYGGGGMIGGATARAFARDGAKVFVAGRTKAKLDRVVADIRAAGGEADAAVVDVLDEASVNAHAEAVAKKAGGIDISLTAAGFAHVQGVPLADLSLEEFERPLRDYLRAAFLPAKAVSRHMAKKGSGVILTLSTPGMRADQPGFLGYGTTCGAIETLSRILAVELGGQGIRVVCLRSDLIPETLVESHVRQVFDGIAARAGTPLDDMIAAGAASRPLLRRFPRLAEIADYAAFVASDRAGAMTGAIANLTCGSVVD